MASRNNHQPLSIITPGINKAEIQKILKKLAPNFKQTILIGYPPFIKDVIDEAVEDGVDLKKLNMRLMFAAEVFTEQFRDYLAEKTGINNVYLDTLNIYGTADIGAMAWESGISIVLKRLLSKDEALFEEFFPEIKRMPTIAQYNPHFITFEEENGEILLTANSALPLVRYGVGDHGGVMSFEEVREKLSRFGYDIYKEAEKVGVPKQFVYQLPFVYAYERNDFSTTLYGLQIYPEVVREVLLRKHIAPFVTGKFTMLTSNQQFVKGVSNEVVVHSQGHSRRCRPRSCRRSVRCNSRCYVSREGSAVPASQEAQRSIGQGVLNHEANL
jgi:phenylacetate-CoA ligase